MNGLHIYKGNEYSDEITIKHLLAHTSGLADYFQGKGIHKKSLEDELVFGNDQFWTFEQAIERTKAMKPLFMFIPTKLTPQMALKLTPLMAPS